MLTDDGRAILAFIYRRRNPASLRSIARFAGVERARVDDAVAQLEAEGLLYSDSKGRGVQITSQGAVAIGQSGHLPPCQ